MPHRWQKTQDDHHQTTCGRGRVSRLSKDYYAIWTIRDGEWISVKSWSGQVTHRKSLPAAKHAVEEQIDRDNAASGESPVFNSSRSKSMTTAELDEQDIDQLAEGYKSGEFEDLLTVSECLLDIARSNPTVFCSALAAIVDLAEIEYGPSMAAAA